MHLSTWKNLDRHSGIFKLEDLAYISQENSKSINIISTLHEYLCMSTLVTKVTTAALLPGLPMHILLLFLTLLHNCHGHKYYLTSWLAWLQMFLCLPLLPLLQRLPVSIGYHGYANAPQAFHTPIISYLHFTLTFAVVCTNNKLFSII